MICKTFTIFSLLPCTTTFPIHGLVHFRSYRGQLVVPRKTEVFLKLIAASIRIPFPQTGTRMPARHSLSASRNNLRQSTAADRPLSTPHCRQAFPHSRQRLTLRGMPKEVQSAKLYDEYTMAPSTGCNAMKQCDVSYFGVQGRVTLVLLGSSGGHTVVPFMR